jgi:cell division protein FtsN
MPDLNLIDEGGFEETPTPAATPAKKKIKSSGGGGGGKVIVILLMILILCGAAAYFLNQRGIINLWGKKKPLLTQRMEDEQFPQEPIVQQEQPKALLDTTMSLLDTPLTEENPMDQPAAEAKPVKGKIKKSKAVEEKSEVVETTEASSKLSDMQGEYTVQVVAFKDKEQADETRQSLEIAGYPAFVEKVPMKGGSWYTVRIGRYATPEDAKNAVKDFAAQLQEHYVIDKIRTK